ncbi:MAG TPA: 6-phosphogluconolactonase [Caulobacteraceae bacterium]|nr:6-phosphogluconolactonase [Caulobacteraceae bacterium]
MSRAAFEAFEDRDALADAACRLIARALSVPEASSLVVTGGSSPGPVYDRLSRLELRWARIIVTLSDDRWLDAASPLSNARLVRERLLIGPAAKAAFLPLKCDAATPDEDADAAEATIATLLPFAAVLLGMGEDGHIASLFPGAPGSAEALDPDGPRLCVGVAMSGLEPYVPRISLTVRALTTAAQVIILITGEAKRAIVERALAEAAYDPPVAAILRQDRAPVAILWAP